MDYVSLIHDFIDGTLKKDSENELFYALSSSDDLRSELRQMMIIDTAMQKDLNNMMPSSESTMNLFTRLGFTAAGEPAAPEQTPLPAPFFSRLLQSAKPYAISNIITSLLSAGLMAIIMYFLLKPDTNNINNQNITGNRDNHDKKGLQYPFVNSYTVPDQLKENEKSTQMTNNRKVQKAATNYKNDETVVSDQETGKLPVITLNRSSADNHLAQVPSSVNFNSRAPMTLPIYAVVPLTIEQKNEIEKKFGLTVQLNSQRYLSIPKQQVGESSIPWLNNTGLTVLYTLNNRLSAGIDLRQEYFYQEYSGKGTDGKMYDYMQQPNFLSIAAIGRYNILAYDKLESFADLYLGGNKAGALGRISLGFSYSPSNDYMLILAFEGSELMYRHLDRYFFTTKLGLHYSVAFRF